MAKRVWLKPQIDQGLCTVCSDRKQKETYTPTSLHGRCLDCGYQKHHSFTLAKREKERSRAQ